MDRCRGQASVEAIAIVGAIVLVVGAAAAAGAFSALPAFALGPSGPSPAALAYLDRAIARPAGDGPTIADALLRLAPEVGPARARALAIDRLLRVYAAPGPTRREALADPSWALERTELDGIGVATTEVWAVETERAPATARIVDARDEGAWSASLRPSTAERAVGLATSAATAAVGAIGPEVSFAALVLGTAAGALDAPARGVPPGSRTGDAVVCRFVWRRNEAVPGWAADHPVDAGRLALGRKLPVVELTIVRAGAPIAHVAVRSRATAC